MIVIFPGPPLIVPDTTCKNVVGLFPRLDMMFLRRYDDILAPSVLTLIFKMLLISFRIYFTNDKIRFAITLKKNIKI